MIFYRFHEIDGPSVVITNDITGANLPRTGNGWKADGRTGIRESRPGRGMRFGVEASEIIETIEREGYFMGTVRGA